jgi:sulfur carrier protein
VTVLVNGEARDVAPAVTLSGLLTLLGHDPRGAGLAVAVNGEVVPRGAWAVTALGERDRIEVLGAAQGG